MKDLLVTGASSDPMTDSEGLAEQALAGVAASFDRNGHRPSEAMWEAIRAIAETMEAMAEERAEETFFLSSLDPGVGKTTTLVHFIRALVASPDHVGASALVCVARLSEIPRLIEDMGLGRDEVGVLTSNPECNALGRHDHDNARILLTTQQMVISRLGHGRSFSFLTEFHFEGSPRQVRVWDEAMSPGETLTVSRRGFASLLERLEGPLPDVADVLEEFFNELCGKEDLDQVLVPDFEQLFGVTLNQVLGILADDPTEVAKPGKNYFQERACVIWRLGGKLATVRHDGPNKMTALDYEDILPDDFMPVLILDASGRVKPSYRLWEEKRGTLKQLPAGPKSYAALLIHLWRQAGGKSAFFDQDKRHQLIEGIAKAINSKPSERFLVVHHKRVQRGSRKLDVVRDLLPLIVQPKLMVQRRNEVTGEMEDHEVDRVSFTHWGDHKATNEFREIPNVILAGTLFLPNSVYEATTRLAKGAKRGELVERSEVKETTLGEYNDLILQAACRGLVRQCVDGGCPPSNLYLIAATKTGIEAELPHIFPGARIETWSPVTSPLRGKVKKAVAYLRQRFAVDRDQLVRFQEVMKAVGVSTSQTFSKDIRKHPRFQEAIARLGIVEYGEKIRNTGFMLESALFGFEIEEDPFEQDQLEPA